MPAPGYSRGASPGPQFTPVSRAIEERFAAEFAAPCRHVVGDFSAETYLLLILFCGIAGGTGMPADEFFRGLAVTESSSCSCETRSARGTCGDSRASAGMPSP
jgi:hypothetical protein